MVDNERRYSGEKKKEARMMLFLSSNKPGVYTFIHRQDNNKYQLTMATKSPVDSFYSFSDQMKDNNLFNYSIVRRAGGSNYLIL